MKQIKSFFEQKSNYVKFIVFLLVLFLNILTVKTSDDLGYSINHGLIDIFQKEYIQYMTWTGRSVAHIIARIFLSMPKAVFNIFNSLIFCVQAELIGRHAVGTKKEVSPLLYILISITVFLFVPVFGQTVLWETGSCNYLWTTTIILAFLYQYRKGLDQENSKNTRYILIMFLFGVVSGWTNENTGGACILMVIAFLFLNWKQKQKAQLWMFAGLAGSVIGFMLMILAPGNAIRSADFITEGGKAYVLVHDLLNAIDVFGTLDGQIILWVGFAVVLTCAFLLKKNKQILLGIFFALSGMAAVLAIIISPVPVYFDRSMYGATILLITGIMVILAPMLDHRTLKHGTILTLAVMAVFTVLTYGRAVIDLAYTRYQFQNRETWVSTQKQEGNVNPVLPQINSEFFTTYNAMYGLNDILDYPSFVNNVNYAVTHGLESVTSTTLDKWNNLYRGGDPKLMNLLDMEDYLTCVKNDPNLVGIMTCSSMNEQYKPYLELLSSFTGDKNLNNASNFILTFSGSETDIQTEDTAFGKEVPLDGHYVWVSSDEDPTHSDIVIDGMEYTNDIEGISIVVFDKEQGKAVDSVTWNTDYGMRGQRSYIER